jgi:putative ABC transport system permease protein
VTLALLALRNLARNRRRTGLSLLIVAAGAVALLMTAGFIRFSFDGLRNSVIHGGLGHLEVVLRDDVGGIDAATDRTSPPRLEDWQEVRATVEASPYVMGATGAIPLHGLATRGDRTIAFVGAALEPDREARMGLVLRQRGGQPLPVSSPEEGEDEVLLGRGLAKLLGVEVGGSVTLTALTADRTLNALDVRVRGLVTTGIADLDSRFLKVHLLTAQRLLATPAVSSLIVGLDSDDHTAGVAAALEARLANHHPPLAVMDWQSRAPYYRQVQSLYQGIFRFLGVIVFVLICLSVSNTLLMAVMERVREIGTLLAIGTSRIQIVTLVGFEALWLGLLGSLLGDVLGFVLGLGLNAAGIRMPPPPGAAEGIPLRLTLLPADFLWVLAVMVTVVMVAVVLPAARAVRLRIVEALAHV